MNSDWIWSVMNQLAPLDGKCRHGTEHRVSDPTVLGSHGFRPVYAILAKNQGTVKYVDNKGDSGITSLAQAQLTLDFGVMCDSFSSLYLCEEKEVGKKTNKLRKC